MADLVIYVVVWVICVVVGILFGMVAIKICRRTIPGFDFEKTSLNFFEQFQNLNSIDNPKVVLKYPRVLFRIRLIGTYKGREFYCETTSGHGRSISFNLRPLKVPKLKYSIIYGYSMRVTKNVYFNEGFLNYWVWGLILNPQRQQQTILQALNELASAAEILEGKANTE